MVLLSFRSANVFNRIMNWRNCTNDILIVRFLEYLLGKSNGDSGMSKINLVSNNNWHHSYDDFESKCRNFYERLDTVNLQMAPISLRATEWHCTVGDHEKY